MEQGRFLLYVDGVQHVHSSFHGLNIPLNEEAKNDGHHGAHIFPDCCLIKTIMVTVAIINVMDLE